MPNVECNSCGKIYNDEKFDICPKCKQGTKEPEVPESDKKEE